MRAFFVGIIILLSYQTAMAYCGCKPAENFGGKQYQLYEKTWYGTKRHWSCEYVCKKEDGTTEQVRGYYKDWYTSDKGLEGICEGLVYREQYNNNTGWFAWFLEGEEVFIPSKSKSPEVRSWAGKNCPN